MRIAGQNTRQVTSFSTSFVSARRLKRSDKLRQPCGLSVLATLLAPRQAQIRRDVGSCQQKCVSKVSRLTRFAIANSESSVASANGVTGTNGRTQEIGEIEMFHEPKTY